MRLTDLERCASRHLNVPVTIAHAEEPLELQRLTVRERGLLDNMRYEQRRNDWLSGRYALKLLLRRLGRGDDTSDLSFPNRQLSLTHAGGSSVAVGTTMASVGFGVDYEPLRQVDSRIVRWFLTRHETEWLDEQPDRDAQLIRLWTVKEAAFKCCLDNDRLTLQELAIEDPSASSVEVTRREDQIKVSCSRWKSGYLSIAKFGSQHEN